MPARAWRFKSSPAHIGRLAQLVERYIDVVDVIGSSPIPPTTRQDMKERIKQIPSQDPDSVRKLESQKYSGRDLQDAVESSPANTYEWFEDAVIQKKASVELSIDAMGLESATIRMTNPGTGKKEIVYHTNDELEVTRLKGILGGGTITIDESEGNPEESPYR